MELWDAMCKNKKMGSPTVCTTIMREPSKNQFLFHRQTGLRINQTEIFNMDSGIGTEL